MTLTSFATFISRLGDPFVMLGVAFGVLLWHSPMFLPAFASMVVLPFVLFFVAWRTRVVSNWDVTKREERPKILWTLILVESICVFVFGLWSVLPVLGALVGFALITQFWKISGHAMASALSTGIIVERFGWNWWPILCIVPLVAWSRVARKNHTPLQVVAGALYAWAVLILT